MLMKRPHSEDAHRKNISNENLRTVFLALFIKNDAANPIIIPITNGIRTIPAIARGETEASPFILLIIEMTVKKTITPIIASIAARGTNVLVTGPFV